MLTTQGVINIATYESIRFALNKLANKYPEVVWSKQEITKEEIESYLQQIYEHFTQRFQEADKSRKITETYETTCDNDQQELVRQTIEDEKCDRTSHKFYPCSHLKHSSYSKLDVCTLFHILHDYLDTSPTLMGNEILVTEEGHKLQERAMIAASLLLNASTDSKLEDPQKFEQTLNTDIIDNHVGTLLFIAICKLFV